MAEGKGLPDEVGSSRERGGGTDQPVGQPYAPARAGDRAAWRERLEEYQADWTRIGTYTAPADRPRAEAAIARLYETIIHPEEVHHHLEGRRLLEEMCTTPELQELAAAATRNTLAIADELRSLTEKATGLHNLPLS